LGRFHRDIHRDSRDRGRAPVSSSFRARSTPWPPWSPGSPAPWSRADGGVRSARSRTAARCRAAPVPEARPARKTRGRAPAGRGGRSCRRPRSARRGASGVRRRRAPRGTGLYR